MIEYKNVDTTTVKGIKDAERLKANGWIVYSIGLFRIQFYRKLKK